MDGAKRCQSKRACVPSHFIALKRAHLRCREVDSHSLPFVAWRTDCVERHLLGDQDLRMVKSCRVNGL